MIIIMLITKFCTQWSPPRADHHSKHWGTVAGSDDGDQDIDQDIDEDDEDIDEDDEDIEDDQDIDTEKNCIKWARSISSQDKWTKGSKVFFQKVYVIRSIILLHRERTKENSVFLQILTDWPCVLKTKAVYFVKREKVRCIFWQKWIDVKSGQFHFPSSTSRHLWLDRNLIYRQRRQMKGFSTNLHLETSIQMP